VAHEEIRRVVADYYSGKVKAHGASAEGVDWNSEESQYTRFDQLTRICDDKVPFTVNDYGCGYGALADYLRERGYDFQYRGFDISDEMIRSATDLHGDLPGFLAVTDESLLEPADYTIASGIFSVKLEADAAQWRDYMLATLDRLAALSTKGFSFNFLTTYSDPERMRSDLYYADPCYLFDRCKRRYSKWVALLHDYGLYEATILVRLD